MPKTKLQRKFNEPQPKYLAELLRSYKKSGGYTAEDIAAYLACSPQNVRCQMNKPAKQWNVGKLFKYCDMLGVPKEDAIRAAVRETRGI